LSLAAISAITIGISISQLHHVAWWQWLCFGSFLLLANWGEYWLHRIPFHNPTIPNFSYYAHVSHHGFFNYKRMACDDLNDLRFVMFDVWTELMVIIGAVPATALLYFLVAHNVGWLYLLAIMTYYSVYELTHALAHLPENNPIGALRIVQAYSHHHRVHHDTRLMRRYNFNFAIPIFDWLHGTRYRGPYPALATETREPSAAGYRTASSDA
jgi:fatty acid hydroxylase family protein